MSGIAAEFSHLKFGLFNGFLGGVKVMPGNKCPCNAQFCVTSVTIA